MVRRSKSRKKKKKGILIVVIVLLCLVVVPSIIFYFFINSYMEDKVVGSKECVGNETISPYCEGGGSKSILQKICVNNIWVEEVYQMCGEQEQCAFGRCFSTDCGSYEPYCINDFELVTPYCENGELHFSREVCGERTPYSEIKGYCKDGRCYVQPSTCGDGICQSDEDSVSCYRDCSVINSADLFARDVSANIEELYPYLECDNDFDCNSPEVVMMADTILHDYNIPDGNPQMYTDAVVDYVNEYITYHFGGGTYQCGESASTMINRAWGNCVDYSVLTISLLRAKGIPARQVAGCVSHKSWFCHSFALRDMGKLGGVPINWRDSTQHEAVNQQVVGGEVLGHSWIEVWIGDEKGWVTADPTVGNTISKKCVGYYPVLYGGTGDMHNDCEGLFGQGPCYTSAYCHIDGDVALEYCKTY